MLRAKGRNSVFIPRGKNDNLGGNTKQPRVCGRLGLLWREMLAEIARSAHSSDALAHRLQRAQNLV